MIKESPKEKLASCNNIPSISTHPALRKIYKYLKEHIIANWETRAPLIEKTQIFSLPIFYQVLLLFNIIKALLCVSYFLFSGISLANITTTLVIVELSIAFILSRSEILDKTFLKYCYIFLFCFEENLTVYYFDCYTCNLNPGFILFILLLILFNDVKTTKAFHEFMFYLYIGNLVLLIYFLSLRNIMNYFVPFNLVLSMFLLLNVISQNYQKKAVKMKVYHQFFEKLVVAMLQKGNMFVMFEDKVINLEMSAKNGKRDVKNKEKSNKDLSDARNGKDENNYFNETVVHESTDSSDYLTEDNASLMSDYESEIVEDFKGFKLAYSNTQNAFNSDFLYFNNNIMSSFLNLLF